MTRIHTPLCYIEHIARRFLAIAAVMACGAEAAHGVVLYVAPDGSGVPPFSSWQTAAQDIQTAVDAAQNGDTVVVAPGVYAASKQGARSRVRIAKPITVRSSEGPAGTIIMGTGPVSKTSVRCVYLSHGAVLEGFTLRGGHARRHGSQLEERPGGGAYVTGGALLSNCVIVACDALGMGAGVFILTTGRVTACTITANGNPKALGGGVACLGGGTVVASVITNNSARYGGGIYCSGGGAIEQCWLQGNQAAKYGGGAYSLYGGEIANSAVLQNNAPCGGGIYAKGSAGVRNCTITGNTASKYGGVYLKKTAGVRNSIIYYNDALMYPNWSSKDPFLHCCMVPIPARYPALTADPGILSADNPRLVRGSICIDAGNNAYATGYNIFGGPRVAGAAVDIGCDEYVGD